MRISGPWVTRAADGHLPLPKFDEAPVLLKIATGPVDSARIGLGWWRSSVQCFVFESIEDATHLVQEWLPIPGE